VGAGQATSDAQAKASSTPAAPKLLYPIGDRDLMTVRESGCEFSFGPGSISYVWTINTTMLMRTAPGLRGLKRCTIPAKRMSAFHSGAKLTCSGLELQIKKVGKMASSVEADSSSWPARLTVRQVATGRRVTLKGEAGVAC